MVQDKGPIEHFIYFIVPLKNAFIHNNQMKCMDLILILIWIVKKIHFFDNWIKVNVDWVLKW